MFVIKWVLKMSLFSSAPSVSGFGNSQNNTHLSPPASEGNHDFSLKYISHCTPVQAPQLEPFPIGEAGLDMVDQCMEWFVHHCFETSHLHSGMGRADDCRVS